MNLGLYIKINQSALSDGISSKNINIVSIFFTIDRQLGNFITILTKL